MNKKRFICSVIILSMILMVSPFQNYKTGVFALDINKITDINTVNKFDDVRGYDFSSLNLKNQSELLFTLTFDTYTKWPAKDKLPTNFDPSKLLAQGKNPGLGIKELQKEGYTGSGIAIAYIDQHLLLDHEAYKNVNLHNYEIQTTHLQPSMHGPAVLSLLSGKDIGIVPRSEVYFFGHNGQKDDNEYEARAFEKIIEINKTLPANKKIRVIGMSHGADDTLSVAYAKHLREAQAAARKSGIIVVDVKCGMATCGVAGFKDRNNYKNYQLSNWEMKGNPARFAGQLLVPADFRTTAIGYKGDTKHYAYWGNGGFSWGVPYITGVIAMGLQLNPKLTEEEAFKYLHESADKHLGGDMINPARFLDLVKQNCKNPRDISLDKDYRYFLYNKNCVSNDDLTSINDYVKKFTDDANNLLIDVSEYSSAYDIYDALKADASKRMGVLKGIQIFGSSADVPAFDVHFKIQMEKSIDDGGNFKSDFFYSNFKNDSKILKDDFSIYKSFNKKLNVSFAPEWTVSRLPLSKDEISVYMKKNNEYVAASKTKAFGNFVNFSNPIFASTKHTDDFGYFLKERLDKEYKILSSGDYKLYGNKKGKYPVTTNVAGDFTKENIAAENKKGIKEFIINSHGQWNNIDQCIYETKNKSSEKRISFLNKSNINQVLSGNYYDLDLWTCLNAYNLDNKNLVHEAMANGKCMSAMAASSIVSNNGVNNAASLSAMKKNNFYYFYLNYFYSRALGETRSSSFTKGLQAYSQEILKNKNLLGEGNYQFNLHNVLAYHYLGLLEYWNYSGKSNLSFDLDENVNWDGNIKFNTGYNRGGFVVKSFKAERAGTKFKLILNYESNRNCGYNFFNPPNANLILKTFNSGIKKGTNTTTLTLSMDEFKKVLSVDSITMRFGFDRDNIWNFIDFKTEQLKPLLYQ